MGQAHGIRKTSTSQLAANLITMVQAHGISIKMNPSHGQKEIAHVLSAALDWPVVFATALLTEYL
jgi:hypothetical protein